jgi:cytidylate kinase
MVLEEVREVLERLLAPTPLRSSPRLRARSRPTQISARVRWVSVDGTAASFKSPLARALAARLGVPYFNSGAAYRYAALWAWCHALDPARGEHQRRVIEHLRQARLRLLPDGALEVDGRRFEHSLGLAEIEQCVADWASLAALRAALTPVWRAALRRKAGVIEGRDAGTVLAPVAQLKLFVDAPRALRAGALAARSGLSQARARKLLERRDRQDRGRAHAPLRVPPGARRLRVSEDNIDRLVARLAADCEER